MRMELECVQAFHDKLGVSPDTKWKTGDRRQAMGDVLVEMSKELEGPVMEGDVNALRDHLLLEELGEHFQATEEWIALDGLTDLAYVLFGTALVYDWPFEEAFSEVHKSNMSKEKQEDDALGARVREKGAGWKPPGLETILSSYRETEEHRPENPIRTLMRQNTHMKSLLMRCVELLNNHRIHITGHDELVTDLEEMLS